MFRLFLVGLLIFVQAGFVIKISIVPVIFLAFTGIKTTTKENRNEGKSARHRIRRMRSRVAINGQVILKISSRQGNNNTVIISSRKKQLSSYFSSIIYAGQDFFFL